VLSAIGTTSATFESDRVDVAINDVWIARGGAAGESRERVDMSGRNVVICIDLHAGDEMATVWTNDLTADYVHENSAYST
jgi:glutamate N-acetyltransferase/amino-acid N-acetyltransferase